LTPKDLDMLEQVRVSNKFATQAEAIRWCIAQTFHLQKMLDDGCKLKIIEKDGREAGIIFV
jgi:hypothetical protein